MKHEKAHKGLIAAVAAGVFFAAGPAALPFKGAAFAQVPAAESGLPLPEPLATDTPGDKASQGITAPAVDDPAKAAATMGDPAEDPLAWETDGAAPAPAEGTPAIPAPAAALPADVPASAPVIPAPDISAPAAVMAPDAPAPAAAVPDAVLGKQVRDLEEKVAALEKQVESLRDTSAPKVDLDALKASIAALEKAAADKPAPVKAQKKKTANAAAPRAPDWVLKSAKPGMAWIVVRGSDELHTISVGESLKGLGRISAIEKDAGGKWVVTGARGRIVQGR